MIDKTLYRYLDENNHTVVSPIEPAAGTEYTTSHRLIADEGKDLINADGNRTKCIDTDSPDDWNEVDEIPEAGDPDND